MQNNTFKFQIIDPEQEYGIGEVGMLKITPYGLKLVGHFWWQPIFTQNCIYVDDLWYSDEIRGRDRTEQTKKALQMIQDRLGGVAITFMTNIEGRLERRLESLGFSHQSAYKLYSLTLAPNNA